MLMGLALVFTGCNGNDSCETEGELRCDGDVLQECVDGKFEDDEDCAANDMICHIEMGHCMTPTE
jgi:hypothetical protein